MKPFALVVSLIFVLAFPALAADNARGAERVQQQTGAFGGINPTAAKFKFCCKNANGRACHASTCSNCTAFCSGDMAVDPIQTDPSPGR